MAAVFFHDEEQKRLATETSDAEASRRKAKIHTKILPASEFTLAEGYHQKYRLQHLPELMREFSAMYALTEDFINSTAAARVNGYVGGHGTLETLKAELDGFGLSPEGNKKLLDIVYEANR
jgi:peptide-methionine (S)-S-oxide reductase